MSSNHTVDTDETDVDTQTMQLAERLREARDYIGLSQESVAEHLGLTRPAVSAIEHGSRKVSSLELKKLAHLYRRPIVHFLEPESGSNAVLSADPFTTALFRATHDLDDTDRDQVLKFAEFLRQGPPPQRGA